MGDNGIRMSQVNLLRFLFAAVVPADGFFFNFHSKVSMKVNSTVIPPEVALMERGTVPGKKVPGFIKVIVAVPSPLSVIEKIEDWVKTEMDGVWPASESEALTSTIPDAPAAKESDPGVTDSMVGGLSARASTKVSMKLVSTVIPPEVALMGIGNVPVLKVPGFIKVIVAVPSPLSVIEKIEGWVETEMDGVWPASRSEVITSTIPDAPAAKESDPGITESMTGGLSTAELMIVRVNCSMTVSVLEEAVMVMLVGPRGTLRSGAMTRVAVPLPLVVNVA